MAEDREPTDDEILAAMRVEAKHMFEKPETSPHERAQIWQGAKKRWRAEHRPVTNSPQSPPPLEWSQQFQRKQIASQKTASNAQQASNPKPKPSTSEKPPSGFLGLPPQLPESRPLTKFEIVGLLLAIAIPVSGFILSAPSAAGVTGVWEARQLLVAAWLLTVVGAFAIEKFSHRSWKRVSITVLSSAIIMAACLFLIDYRIGQKKLEQDKREQDTRATQQQQKNQGVPDLAGKFRLGIGRIGKGTGFTLLGEIANHGAPSLVEQLTLIIKTPKGTLLPEVVPLRAGARINLPSEGASGGDMTVIFNPLAEQAIRIPIPTNGQIIGQMVFILPNVSQEEYIKLGAQEFIHFVDSTGRAYDFPVGGIRRILTGVPYIPGMEIEPLNKRSKGKAK